MGIQSTGNVQPVKTTRNVVITLPTANTVSAEIIAASPTTVKFNLTNNNPTASMWFTSDPAVLAAVAALPCVELPVGANADFDGNTAVRAIWPAGTTGAGVRIIQTIAN